MHDLSHALIELYGAVEHMPLPLFLQEASRFLRMQLRIDAAAFGVIDNGPAEKHEAPHTRTFVFAQEKDKVCDAGEIAMQSGAIAQALARADIFAKDCASFFHQYPEPALEAFCMRHGLRHAMLTREGSGTQRERWLAVFRRADDPFGPQECNALQLIRPHLAHALHASRARQLERQVCLSDARAAALIGHGGIIESADARFHELLGSEYTRYAREQLPPYMYARLRESMEFEGGRIFIAASFHKPGEFMLCKAYERNLLSMLTPAELSVARHFSRGLTHKDVALKLGVSQNTVKTHIKHVYDKLAINSKVHLAQLMESNRVS